MFKSYYLFIASLFLCTHSLAQSPLLPVYEIQSDTSNYLALNDGYWQYLEDKDGKLTFNNVSKLPATGNFIKPPVGKDLVNYKIHYYWLRYQLKNGLPKELRLCLTNASNADQTDFYLLRANNQNEHFTTGTLVSRSKKDGLKSLNAIPIVLQPGETVQLYNRLKNNYYFNKPEHLRPAIGFTDNIIQEEYINKQSNFSLDNFNWINTGILFFACFFSLLFYFVVKEKVYIYYALFLFYFLFEYDLFADLIFPGRPILLFTITYFVKASGVLIVVQFCRHFLKTFEKYPLWDKFLIGIGIFQLIVKTASFLIEPHLTGKWSGMIRQFSYFSFVCGIFMVLITFLKSFKDRNKASSLLEFSAIPAFIFWSFGFAITIFYDVLQERWYINPPKFVIWLNKWFEFINLLNVTWFVISFSGVLLLQYIKLKKANVEQKLEKERLAKEKEIEKGQLIEQKKIELEKTVGERTIELRNSLENLKNTQNQLIQSAKMASLGELTAGIAHEIQNPLNFVNNFSDLSTELLDEMKTELTNGNNQNAIAISEDLKQNLERINLHGKRADAIVKGMLQHSQSTSGSTESTDINKLADEHLHLALNSMKVKDKFFSPKVQTDYDQSIGNINIIPQNIGRVLLNLYNNAFYEVADKSKQADSEYEPTVSVRTKRMDDNVLISVKDNGNGVPPKILDKIFQPFFTTKPTGQGTGLGLSLSYDIVKAHGGEIKVDTKEKEGSTFKIYLPM